MKDENIPILDNNKITTTIMLKYLIVTAPIQIFDNDDRNVKREVLMIGGGRSFLGNGKDFLDPRKRSPILD